MIPFDDRGKALWANNIQRLCLEESDNVEDALQAAEIIIATQPFPGISLAVRHAPPDGVTIGGKEYPGGEFIPDEAWEKATPEEKSNVEETHSEREHKAKDFSSYIAKFKSKGPSDNLDREWLALPASERYETWSSELPQSEKDRLANIEKANKITEVEKNLISLRKKAEKRVTRLIKAGAKITQAAFKKGRQVYISGQFHNISVVPGGLTQSVVAGFVTDTGEFLDREEAGLFAEGKMSLMTSEHFHKSGVMSLDSAFAFDIHNRRAQGILNRSLQAAKGLSEAAKKDLTAALKKGPADQGEAILRFIDKYRIQLAKLLTTTQLASVLEGAREVAASVPTLAIFPGAVAPPPSLEPKEAVDLVERLSRLEGDARAEAIYALPADQQQYAQQALAAKEAGPVEPPRFTPPVPASDTPEGIHLPIIDEAVKQLAEKNVMTRDRYDQLDAAAKAKAFAVAGVDAQETLTKIRDVLAENVRTGADYETFREKVLEAVDEGTFMSEGHQETVFRTNVQAAFSDGQMTVLNHPLVRSGFPYSTIDPIHDDRVEDIHLAMGSKGIGGSNIYRINDPVFQTFRPPWRWQCRCSWTPLTVRQAAEAGVKEAQRWLDTGVEPSPPAFVPMPDFQPPPGFRRALASSPLSIQLSMQSLSMFEKRIPKRHQPMKKHRHPGVLLSLFAHHISAMFAQVHAPHNMVIHGKQYRGGQFIPGEVIATMDQKEKDELLNKEHIRADDEGQVIGHFQAGHRAAQAANDSEAEIRKTTLSGDAEFQSRIQDYFSKHLANVAKTWDEAANDDPDKARDEAEQDILEVGDHYKNAITNHLKTKWGDYFKAGDADAFNEAIDESVNHVIENIYASAESGKGEHYQGTMNLMQLDLPSAMRNAADEFAGAMEEAADEEESAGQDQRKEVEAQFEDVQSDVDMLIDDDSTQEDIDAAWDEMIRDYNKILDDAGDDNPYRISIDSNGDLEVVDKDDLPEEHKPKGKSLAIEDELGNLHSEETGRFVEKGVNVSDRFREHVMPKIEDAYEKESDKLTLDEEAISGLDEWLDDKTPEQVFDAILDPGEGLITDLFQGASKLRKRLLRIGTRELDRVDPDNEDETDFEDAIGEWLTHQLGEKANADKEKIISTLRGFDTAERQRKRSAALAVDASGHEHKAKGKGGGQFVSKGKGGASEPKQDDTETVNDAAKLPFLEKGIINTINTVVKWTGGGEGKPPGPFQKVYHYLHEKAEAGFHKLPEAVQKAVSISLATAFTGYIAGQAVAERLAKERGCNEAQAKQVKKVLAALDLVAFKATAGPLAAAGPVGVAASWTIPPATAAYLVMATATNPMATYRAAKKIVSEVKDASQAKIDEHTQRLSIENGEGRWITIGAKAGEDGKKHGGTPVYIENGRITKGAPSLHGKKIDALKEPATPSSWDDRSHLDNPNLSQKQKSGITSAQTKAQREHERNYRRAVWAKEARKQGIDATSLRQLAIEMKTHHDANINEINNLLQRAREYAANMKVPIHPKQLSETGDYANIPGFDLLSRSMATEFPDILGQHGAGHNEGYDHNANEASEKLLTLLRSGKQPLMDEDQAYQEALDYLVDVKQSGHVSTPISDEPIPFSATTP